MANANGTRSANRDLDAWFDPSVGDEELAFGQLPQSECGHPGCGILCDVGIRAHRQPDVATESKHAKRASKDLVDEARRLRRQGLTYREVGQRLDMSHTWVAQVTRGEAAGKARVSPAKVSRWRQAALARR